MKNKLHAFISVGCPNVEKGHANFRWDEKKNRFICNTCNKDFTKEMKEIYVALKEQFADKS